MQLQAILRTMLFKITGKLWLSDPVRNFVYQRALGSINSLSARAAILDIGSRDSLFPAFLARRGYALTVIDPWNDFSTTQNRIMQRWQVHYEVHQVALHEITAIPPVSAALAFFSLQHAKEHDTAGFIRMAQALKPGGILLTANEYNHTGSCFQTDRPDGAMRRYGPEDLVSRIIEPVKKQECCLIEKSYISWASKEIRSVEPSQQANISLLIFKKKELP